MGGRNGSRWVVSKKKGKVDNWKMSLKNRR